MKNWFKSKISPKKNLSDPQTHGQETPDAAHAEGRPPRKSESMPVDHSSYQRDYSIGPPSPPHPHSQSSPLSSSPTQIRTPVSDHSSSYHPTPYGRRPSHAQATPHANWPQYSPQVSYPDSHGHRQDHIVRSSEKKLTLVDGLADSTIAHGHFALMHEKVTGYDDAAVIRNARNLDISGGQFVLGDVHGVTHFVRETAEVANNAFRREERTSYGQGTRRTLQQEQFNGDNDVNYLR